MNDLIVSSFGSLQLPHPKPGARGQQSHCPPLPERSWYETTSFVHKTFFNPAEKYKQAQKRHLHQRMSGHKISKIETHTKRPFCRRGYAPQKLSAWTSRDRLWSCFRQTARPDTGAAIHVRRSHRHGATRRASASRHSQTLAARSNVRPAGPGPPASTGPRPGA